MEIYVWKSGEPPERSLKETQEIQNTTEPHILAMQEGNEFQRSSAVAVGVDNRTIDKVELAINMAEHSQLSNRRENTNDKLHNRHMIHQVNKNPYFHNSDYVSDLEVQESFLRARESNTQIIDNV